MRNIVFLDYDEVVILVCEYSDITRGDLSRETRKAEIVMARVLISYMLLYIGYSMNRIAMILNKDRSTIHYYKKTLSDGVDFKVIIELTKLRIFLANKNILLPNLSQFNHMMKKYNYKSK